MGSGIIVDKYSVYADPIPGSEWISIDANLGFPVGDNQEIRYRRFFDLPKDCHAKKLSVILHVDNDAAVFLNGVSSDQRLSVSSCRTSRTNRKDPSRQRARSRKQGTCSSSAEMALALSRASTMRPP